MNIQVISLANTRGLQNKQLHSTWGFGEQKDPREPSTSLNIFWKSVQMLPFFIPTENTNSHSSDWCNQSIFPLDIDWMLGINFQHNSIPGVCALQEVFVSKQIFRDGNYPSCTVIQA